MKKILLLSLSVLSLLAPKIHACAAGPADAPKFLSPQSPAATLLTSDGEIIELNAQDAHELQAGMLTGAQNFKREVINIDVSAQTVRELLALIHDHPSYARLSVALRLPIQVQFELCCLYDYLLCDGIFERGCADACTLYANVLASKDFLAEFDGNIPMLARIMPEFILPWNYYATIKSRQLPGHTDCVSDLTFSPDGTILASGSYDNTIKLWTVEAGTEHATLTHPATCITFCPNGKTLASCSCTTVMLWDVETGNSQQLLAQTDWINCITFSPDGKTLAIVSMDGTIKLWDVKTRTECITFSEPTTGITCVAFNPDGKILASGSANGAVRLWDVATGAKLATLSDTGRIRCLAFSPDGQTLASGSSDKTIRLWNVKTGTKLATLSGHTQWVRSIAFSPDGQTLASSSNDFTIKFWNLETCTELTILRKHTNWVTSIAFSPNGKTLASSGSAGKKILLWQPTPIMLEHQLLALKALHAPAILSEEHRKALARLRETLPADAVLPEVVARIDAMLREDQMLRKNDRCSLQ